MLTFLCHFKFWFCITVDYTEDIIEVTTVASVSNSQQSQAVFHSDWSEVVFIHKIDAIIMASECIGSYINVYHKNLKPKWKEILTSTQM